MLFAARVALPEAGQRAIFNFILTGFECEGMTKISSIMIAGVLAAGLGGHAKAQVAPVALSQAEARLACGAGVVLGAVTLPNGSIEVTCEAQAASQVPAALAGALTPEAAAALVVTVVIIGALVGDGGSTSATTTEAASSPPSEE